MAARILFNGLAAGSGGGVGRYAAELGRRLALADERVTVVCTRNDDAQFVGVPAERLIAWTVPALPKGRLLLEEFRLPRLVNQFDLLYQPDFKLPRGIRVPAMVTAHDLFFEEFPRDYGFLQRHYKIFEAGRAARQAVALVSLTSTQAKKIARRYQLPHLPRVIPPGIAPHDFLPRTPAAPPRFLFLSGPGNIWGGRNRRKNGSLLLAAWHQVQRRAWPQLDWCGWFGATPGWPEQKFHHQAKDEKLKALYAAAAALLFPSLDEGFGLPVLEAIAANCPVICSDIPALRESFGNAPVYLSSDPKAWANAMRNDAANPPALDPAARAEVLARHEWPRAIAAHLALINEVLGAAPGKISRPD